MALSLEQKSLYLILFNATQIARSLGKSLTAEELKQFKRGVFDEIEKLADAMERGELTEGHIMKSIDLLARQFGVSYGQAQKPINVIMKYHFYLTRSQDKGVRAVLHCPIDSVQLGRLHRRDMSLSRMNRDTYLEIQQQVEKRSREDGYQTKLDYDKFWDERNLRSEDLT